MGYVFREAVSVVVRLGKEDEVTSGALKTIRIIVVTCESLLASTLLDESLDLSRSWVSIVRLPLSLDIPYPDPSKGGNSPPSIEVL